ncbi:MAG TPA: MmcQ/YjbR family DNA-binding protein, partial [Bryobacteraceae bacterium]|nr:MmcQ/YjbR family DNA-binding protein [Bryobacteraceae bacterium]
FPEAVCERMGDHARFCVWKKVFAYYLNNHHGDGIVSVCVKTLPGEHTALITADPVRYYRPAYIGPRGWVGLRLDVAKVDWDEVNELVTGSYLQVAPKKLASLIRISE